MRHLLLIFLFLFSASSAETQSTPQYDLVVYGGTAAAVTAAVQAKRMGKTVIIVSPDKHLGGLSSGGLGFTDTGDKAVIGGLAREFYRRVWKHYDRPAAWQWEKREEYGNKGQGTPAIDGGAAVQDVPYAKLRERLLKDGQILEFAPAVKGI